MQPLAIESLSVRDFRNLAAVDLDLGARFNVLSGDNGQGKTNLLEAVYVLATSRSFRTSRLPELVRTGADTASVRGRIREGDEPREQSVGVRAGLRAARIDGKRPPTLAAYAVRSPVVVFHPGSVSLSAGGGGERRKLLDRAALYASIESLAHAEAYAKALKTRQRVLEVRGERAPDLDEWETLVVEHGTALSDAREAAADRLAAAAQEAFERIAAPGLSLEARYARTAPREPEAFRTALAANRVRDRARGSAGIGPHRDDLELRMGAHPARGMASQGQHRAIVLALKLAEIEVVARARDVRPILLLDDVSSELDRGRTAALLEVLEGREGQVLLTTTRRELIETGALSRMDDRRDFVVVEGRAERA